MRPFKPEYILEVLPKILPYTAVTLGIMAATVLFGGLLGFLLACAKIRGGKVGKGIANVYIYAFFVFFFNTTAVLSETFRSALLTVSHGQMEAALSVGLSRVQAYVRVIIPQALVAALPNLCNATVNLLILRNIMPGEFDYTI